MLLCYAVECVKVHFITLNSLYKLYKTMDFIIRLGEK